MARPLSAPRSNARKRLVTRPCPASCRARWGAHCRDPSRRDPATLRCAVQGACAFFVLSQLSALSRQLSASSRAAGGPRSDDANRARPGTIQPARQWWQVSSGQRRTFRSDKRGREVAARKVQARAAALTSVGQVPRTPSPEQFHRAKHWDTRKSVVRPYTSGVTLASLRTVPGRRSPRSGRR